MLFSFVDMLSIYIDVPMAPAPLLTPVIPYPHSLSCESLLAFSRWKITNGLYLCVAHT